MKLIRAIAIFSTIILLTNGCGNSVNSVKRGTLAGREQTTIGNAFDAFFNEPKWEIKESANKTQFVEFIGKAKKPVPLDEEGMLVVPEGGNVMIQFILKKKGEFEIGYAEAPIKVNPNLPAEASSMVELTLSLKGIKTDGSSATSIQAEGVNALLDRIYSN
ncbi:MAG: hypothetical protein HOO88_04205 [Kiritimatiellaceae bacterium]|nr:hypothetical protein [Kiritimatiellaceae bacterium]